jgi:hypothetical protein
VVRSVLSVTVTNTWYKILKGQGFILVHGIIVFGYGHWLHCFWAMERQSIMAEGCYETEQLNHLQIRSRGRSHRKWQGKTPFKGRPPVTHVFQADPTFHSSTTNSLFRYWIHWSVSPLMKTELSGSIHFPKTSLLSTASGSKTPTHESLSGALHSQSITLNFW